MAFNSKDTAAFKGVWVFCEQRDGVILSTGYQLLSEGRKLANDLGVELCGVLLGHEVNETYAKALGGYGADRVYICDHPLLKDYTTDAYTKVICDLVEDKKPEIFLIGATNIGRDLGPRVAARLKTGLTADCTHLDVDVDKYKAFLKTTSTIDVDNTKFEANTNLKMTRPAFGGHLMATIVCPDYRPQMSTVRRRHADPALQRGDRCQDHPGEGGRAAVPGRHPRGSGGDRQVRQEGGGPDRRRRGGVRGPWHQLRPQARSGDRRGAGQRAGRRGRRLPCRGG